MAEKLTKRSHIHPNLRIVLYSILLICGGLLFGSIIWIFRRIQASLGVELAEVAVALMSILILALMLVGIRAGWTIDRFIRYRRIDIWKIHKSFRQAQQFITLLGYEEPQPSSISLQDSPNKQNIDETLALIEKPRRRGRPPTHSLERWTRVVLAWENRDLYRNPMTLTEFLSQEFGTYADGSPCMSENSFYENRKKVFDELRKGVVLNQETTS
jgi:hypothetical protein